MCWQERYLAVLFNSVFATQVVETGYLRQIALLLRRAYRECPQFRADAAVLLCSTKLTPFDLKARISIAGDVLTTSDMDAGEFGRLSTLLHQFGVYEVLAMEDDPFLSAA